MNLGPQASKRLADHGFHQALSIFIPTYIASISFLARPERLATQPPIGNQWGYVHPYPSSEGDP